MGATINISKRTDYSLDSIKSSLEKSIIREHLFYNILDVKQDEELNDKEAGQEMLLPIFNKGYNCEKKKSSILLLEDIPPLLIKEGKPNTVKYFSEEVDVKDLDKYHWSSGVSEEIRQFLQDGIHRGSIKSFINHLGEWQDISSLKVSLEERDLTKAGLLIKGYGRKPRFLLTSTEQLLNDVSLKDGFIPYHSLSHDERNTLNMNSNIVGKYAGFYVIATDELEKSHTGDYVNYIFEKNASCLAFSKTMRVEQNESIIKAGINGIEATSNPLKFVRLYVKPN